MRDARQLIGITAFLTALSLGLAACGGDDGGDGDGGEEPKSVASKKDAPATWPLTGLPVDGGGSAEQDHPVLVLKLDNTEASAPQQGLSHADLVVEELVEGGITRLAALYYSDIPGEVGPVRSMRASDIGIVAPVDGAMVASGGAAQTVERISDAGIKIFNEGSPGFFRESTRSAPYNLFTDMGKVAKAAEDGKDALPANYLPWGAEGDLPAGKPANTLTADFGSHATSWAFQNGTYVNQNSYAADATSSLPTACWCCGSTSATPVTPTRPATRCRRPSSRARATRSSSTPARSSRAPGPRTSSAPHSSSRPRAAS